MTQDDRLTTRATNFRALLELPEAHVLVFGLLLNLPWEFWHAPFFSGMADARHWDATKTCTFAAIGDAVIVLISYWTIAAAARTRRWILRPTLRQILGFIAVGITCTIVIERLATGVLDQWSYTSLMPIAPILNVGVVPLAQWALLPLLVLWFVRRQLA